MFLVFVVARAAACFRSCFRLRCDGGRAGGSLFCAKGKSQAQASEQATRKSQASLAKSVEERDYVVSAKERERKGMRRKRVLLRFCMKTKP